MIWMICILSVLLTASLTAGILLQVRARRRLRDASAVIAKMLDGDTTARISCQREGPQARLFHDINSLAAVLNAHADAEQEARSFLKNTIEDISHQLKTPLASLSIYQELLQDASLSPEDRMRFQALSAQELERMELLVQNLLKLTKLDANTVLFEKSPASVQMLLNRTCERFCVRAEQERKNLIQLPTDSALRIECDANWISEALDNLVKNALEHTQPGGTIELSARTIGDNICIQVCDDGCGIPEEDLYHIFKRFYRSRRASEQSGIGLGLPLVKSIAERHGGFVEVDAHRKNGSCFSVYLPDYDRIVGNHSSV